MVSGLPTDIEDDRLTDKLQIHFLRSRNRGGEITSVTVLKSVPGSALITFEENEVARSVFQHGRHILKVDGKKYELTLSEHHKDLDPDKVILSMSVAIDYSQLPQRRTTVTNLHRSHPEIQIDYNMLDQRCTLRGLYSQVQPAVAQLLGLPWPPGLTDTPQPASNGSGGVPTQRVYPPESVDDHRGREERRDVHTEPSLGLMSGEQGFGPYGDQAYGRPAWETTTDGAEGGTVALPPLDDSTAMEEDLSLIMDADMFLYLQRQCGQEYQQILRRHGVEVVDVTAQGVTTLYLRLAPGDAGSGLERLRGARGELSRLYQENEAKLRRAQLTKSILSPRGGLQSAMDSLAVRFPRLLLSEDDRNVYIVGSSSDVSEAKQFLLLDHEEPKLNVDSVASLLGPQSFGSGSLMPAEEERLPAAYPSKALAPNVRVDRMLRSQESERRTEGARGYKLAARFKDSGVGGLASRPGEYSPSLRPGLGPVLGHDALFGSERAGLAGGGPIRPVTQNTGEDILFKSGDPLFPIPSMEHKLFTPSTSVSKGHQASTSLSSTQATAIPASLPAAGLGSGSGLRRTSSFSGQSRPREKDAGRRLGSADDSAKAATRVRPRSNSLSNRTGREGAGVYSAEVTVSTVMWQYIKEAYSARLEDMTTDLRMRDSQSEGSRDVTVTLTGAEPSRVNACQLELQKLVAMVTADFHVQQLLLAELGVADSADETLQVCCAEVRNRFKKVSIYIMRDTLFLVGPKQLCSQVGAALTEVFSGASEQRKDHEDFPTIPSTSAWIQQYIPPKGNGEPNPTLHLNMASLPKLDGQIGGEEGAGGSLEKKTVQRGDSTKRQRKSETELKSESISQSSSTKDPVVKKTLQKGGAVEVDWIKADTFTTASSVGNGGGRGARLVNGVGPGSVSALASQDVVAVVTDGKLKPKAAQKDDRAPSGPEEQEQSGGALSRRGSGRSSLRGAQGLCVCGQSGASTKRTGCGVVMCPQCLVKVHMNCRVCHKTEPAPRGIQGKMSVSEMLISVQGHGRDSTVKVTYNIPDGIQGDAHPSPGSPFTGGLFEAFLPLCERTKRLLPRLERAFKKGLTFTVIGKDAEAQVTWDCIPHKTSLQGGKSSNGYPDSSYLARLSQALTTCGIEEVLANSQDPTRP